MKHVPGIALAGALVMLAGTGCGPKDKAKEAARPGRAAPTLAALDAVPADTPYVFALLEPVPATTMDEMLEEAQPELEKLEQAAAAIANKGGPSGPEEHLVVILVDELHGKLSRQGLESLGFRGQPRFVVYGLGVMPVLRLELSDGAKVKALVQRILDKTGAPVEVRTHAGIEYWRLGGGDDEVVVFAVVKDELVAGIAPASVEDRWLPVLLGVERPKESLAQAGTLDELRKGGMGTHALGVLDTRKMAALLLGSERGLAADLTRPLREELGELSATCRSEIQSFVAHVPRVMLGIEELSGEAVAVSLSAELPAKLAGELEALKGGVPGMSLVSDGTMMTLGVALDVGKALDLVRARARAHAAAPYRCELLADWNEAAEALSSTAPPIPPIVRDVRGVYLAVKQARFGAGPPTGIEAVGVLGIKDPGRLVTLAQSFVPQLAHLKLEAGGAAVPLPVSVPFLESPHLAMGRDGIGVSVGRGVSDWLTTIVGKKPDAGAPFALLTYDMAKIADNVSEAREAMKGYGRGEITMSLTDTGITIRARQQLR